MINSVLLRRRGEIDDVDTTSVYHSDQHTRIFKSTNFFVHGNAMAASVNTASSSDKQRRYLVRRSTVLLVPVLHSLGL